jgi:hypothetical protein
MMASLCTVSIVLLVILPKFTSTPPASTAMPPWCTMVVPSPSIYVQQVGKNKQAVFID